MPLGALTPARLPAQGLALWVCRWGVQLGWTQEPRAGWGPPDKRRQCPQNSVQTVSLS